MGHSGVHREQPSSFADHDEVFKQLREPLLATGENATAKRSPCAPSEAQLTSRFEHTMTDQFAGGPFEEITNDQYEAEHAAAKAAHVTAEDMPLNPEQRAAARNLLAYVNLHASLRDISNSETIAQRARALGLSAVTLLLGPGETGKSQVTKSITREIAKRGHGAVIVTAYTGVAAAPFGGPTLLSLLNMKPHTKSEGLTDLEPTQLVKLREKFKKESGVDIRDVAAIIIDEISFVDTKILGHVSHTLSQLFNENHQDQQRPKPVCGVVPMLLCGDVHQLVGPGSKAWYKELVENNSAKPAVAGTYLDAPEILGRQLMRQARLVKLTRLMRVDKDRISRPHNADCVEPT